MVSVNDQVWVNANAKRAAILKMAQVSPGCGFVCWFEHTKAELEQVFRSNNIDTAIDMADSVSKREGVVLWVFVEHYPLAEKEQQIFKKLNLSDVPVLSSLDEPFFQMFGGERMQTLMQRLGMSEDEIVAHPMITRAIKNAQKKIATEVKTERHATSQEEWYKVNLNKQL